MPPHLPVLLPSSWPCFSMPVTVYCCMGMARSEEEGETFGINFLSNSSFFLMGISVGAAFCSPLMCCT